MNKSLKNLTYEQKVKRAAAVQLFTALFSATGGMFILLRFGTELFACSQTAFAGAMVGNPVDYCMSIGEGIFRTMLWLMKNEPQALGVVSGTIHVTITSLTLGVTKILPKALQRRASAATITKPPFGP